MLDGLLVLEEPNVVPFFFQKLKSLPKRSQEILFSIIIGLFSRQTRAGDGTESYCYEMMSRFRWKSYGGHSPHTQSGIPGQEKLGTNYVQRMWTFYNEVEDRRLAEEAAWEGTKLIVSAQAPKGVKKIDTHDRQAKQKEAERRQEVQDQFFYVSTGVIAKAGLTPEGEKKAPSPFAPKSDEQLAQEMHSWVAGKEDDHDRVVNNYKQQVVARYEAEKAAREKRAADFRKHLDSMDLPARASPLVGYTQGQLSQILQHRNPGRPGARTVFEGEGRGDYVYTKYLERTPDTGGLAAAADGTLVLADKGDLTGQVAGRQVSFDTREEG